MQYRFAGARHMAPRRVPQIKEISHDPLSACSAGSPDDRHPAGRRSARDHRPAQAQTYPERPIRLIIPFTPGGGTDNLSRLVGNKLAEKNKWTIVMDNKAGASGSIGIAEAVKAPPTGYEIVMGQADNLAVIAAAEQGGALRSR